MIVRPSPPEQPPELARDRRAEKRRANRRRRLPCPQRSSGGRTRVCRARYYSRRFLFLQKPPHGALQVPVFRSNKTAEEVGGNCVRDFRFWCC